MVFVFINICFPSQLNNVDKTSARGKHSVSKPSSFFAVLAKFAAFMITCTSAAFRLFVELGQGPMCGGDKIHLVALTLSRDGIFEIAAGARCTHAYPSLDRAA